MSYSTATNTWLCPRSVIGLSFEGMWSHIQCVVKTKQQPSFLTITPPRNMILWKVHEFQLCLVGNTNKDSPFFFFYTVLGPLQSVMQDLHSDDNDEDSEEDDDNDMDSDMERLAHTHITHHQRRWDGHLGTWCRRGQQTHLLLTKECGKFLQRKTFFFFLIKHRIVSYCSHLSLSLSNCLPTLHHVLFLFLLTVSDFNDYTL